MSKSPLRCLLIFILCLASGLRAQSLLPDGGFEQGGGDWRAFVPSESEGAGPTFMIVTDQVRSGTRAARLAAAQPARHGFYFGRLPEGIPVQPGERYRIVAWVRADPDTVFVRGTAGLLIRLSLRDASHHDAPGGHIFVGLGGWVGRGIEPPPCATRLPVTWTKIEAVVEMPADAAWIVPTFFAWRAGNAVYFDDVAFEKVPAGTPLSLVATRREMAVPPSSAPPSADLLTPAIQAELFDALDLSRPGLGGVGEALGRADLAGARTALADYLRRRPGEHWLLAPFVPADPDPSFPYRRERAESAAVGRVTPSGLAELWHTFPGNVIDWFRNETRHRPGLAYNQEWQFQLCRMSFWANMADAYRATGDEKYPRAWVIQLRSFMAQCPPPDGDAANRRDSAWRTIECGIRMRDSWPRAFQAFLGSPSVTDDDLLLYLYSNLQHARHLRAHPSDQGNWLTMEMCGLHTIGSVFPEFRDAAAWRTFAIRTMERSLARQFLPDGAQYELSPGYHVVALDQNGMAIPRLARATGRLDEIPPGYIASMEKGYDYLLHLMTPDRSLPRFNDSWAVTWLPRVLGNGQLFFPRRDDWRWVATGGVEGRPPETTSHTFPDAGYQVMRTGWETDATYLAFDTGQPGYAHQHQDKLNLVLWAYGREILFDSGGGSYEDSKWRHYAVDTFSHNTVLVDGMPQRRSLVDRVVAGTPEPEGVVWESSSDQDFAAASYEGAYSRVSLWADRQPEGPAVHTRRVLFAKPDVVIVADTLTPRDGEPHTYQARWHLLPVRVVRDDETGAVTTADDGEPNLAVIPLRPEGLDVRVVSGQTEPEPLGWNVRKDLDPQYVPATTVTHTRSGTGVQTFVTLLHPLRPGAGDPVRAVEAGAHGDIRVTLASGGALVIAVDPMPKGPITVRREGEGVR